jgi:hypothetical protein
VRVECKAPVQQILGIGQGFGRWQDEVIRNAWDAFSALRKWSTEGVAGTIASGPARFVAITFSHVFIMSSMEIQLPRLRDRPIPLMSMSGVTACSPAKLVADAFATLNPAAVRQRSFGGCASGTDGIRAGHLIDDRH